MARCWMSVGCCHPHSSARSVSHVGRRGKRSANVSVERVASPNVL